MHHLLHALEKSGKTLIGPEYTVVSLEPVSLESDRVSLKPVSLEPDRVSLKPVSLEPDRIWMTLLFCVSAPWMYRFFKWSAVSVAARTTVRCKANIVMTPVHGRRFFIMVYM